MQKKAWQRLLNRHRRDRRRYPVRAFGGQQRQPCRRGHFFVLLAGRDHVLFEYMPRETSGAVAEMFRGFGYMHADAKSVYDVLFRARSDLERRR